MLQTGKMSDKNLRKELISFGYKPGPITDSTRKVLEKKLEKLRAEAKKPRNNSKSSGNARRTRCSEPQDGSDAEDDETQTSDWRRQSHGQYQLPKERVSWDTVRQDSRWRTDRRVDGTGQEAGSWRVDDSRYPGTSITFPVRTEESTLWRRERASLPGDNPQRRDIGYNMHLADDPESRSLSYNRYTSDNPEGRSLDYNRYTSDNPESRFLSYNRYTSDNPEGSSLDYNSYASDKRGSLGYNRYLGDNPEKRSLGFNRHSGDELRYRPIGDISRDQSTSPYIFSSRTALGSLSHKTHPGLGQEKVSHLKPAWSKNLEYYLSRLLRVLCVILVLVFAGILIVKSGILSTSQDNGMELLPSDCEDREDPFCKAKQKKITLQILSELYDFLSLEAGNFECGNPSGLSSKCVPINSAKEHVMNVGGYAAEKFDTALDWLLSIDQHLGIWAKGKDTEELVTARADVFCVESSRPRLGFVCRLKNALYTAISNLFLALLGIFILWIILIFLRYHWQRLEEEEKQMFVMVEKIIDVIKRHYKDWLSGREQNPYVGILHVRDSLIMPKDRKHLKKVWDRAVQFVEDNESRVRIELQRVAGADLKVWRWTQTQNENLR